MIGTTVGASTTEAAPTVGTNAATAMEPAATSDETTSVEAPIERTTTAKTPGRSAHRSGAVRTAVTVIRASAHSVMGR